ncbi:MAG: hypothetical protein LVQ63_00090 [Thermoplasmatales archaeon]|nr:hypothetical protein [Thermoplasmatales archaeon]
MNRLLAEIPRDQEMIDRLVEKNKKLKEENYISSLSNPFQEYQVFILHR